MKKTPFLVIFISFITLTSHGFSTEVLTETKQPIASLSIVTPVKPEGMITVRWQGPDKPRDQIVLSISNKLGYEPVAFVYTARGNPVKFQEPGSDIFEISYKMFSVGTIASLRVDCRKEVRANDGTCIILSQIDEK